MSRRKPLQRFRLQLERLMRYKPHTLGQGEEKLLAMQSEMADAADQMFRQLTDADLKFGMCRNEKGESVELSQRYVFELPALAEPRRAPAARSTSTTSSSRVTRTRWPRR